MFSKRVVRVHPTKKGRYTKKKHFDHGIISFSASNEIVSVNEEIGSSLEEEKDSFPQDISFDATITCMEAGILSPSKKLVQKNKREKMSKRERKTEMTMNFFSMTEKAESFI